MTNGIRLTEDDYIKLYPLWKPLEIQNEYPPHAHCESQIRNYYRRLKYSTQGRAYKSLFKAYMNDRPESISLADWKRIRQVPGVVLIVASKGRGIVLVEPVAIDVPLLRSAPVIHQAAEAQDFDE